MRLVSVPRPNLFDYATSELSQDAFICWLLAWGDAQHREADPEIHNLGVRFIQRLFESHSRPCPEPPFQVEVSQQVKGVDVVALVGDAHVLIVEDKVHTSDHTNQLTRYREAMASEFPGRTLLCVYLKTGDQSSYADVIESGWATLTRPQFLEVLRSGREFITDTVFVDFLSHLEAEEVTVQRYKTAPVEDWERWDGAYRGLYMQLQERLGEGAWGYVPNPAGGFFGFWFNWCSIEGGELYLQLEEDSLVAKVAVSDRGQRSRIRNVWSQRVCERLGTLGFRKPSRFGHGKYMTVAVYVPDYRISTEQGLLDLDKTAELLKRVATHAAALAANPSVRG